ncbi:hypothetical protein GPECTOR_59g623 [Gonium pectorale]|uniref:Uncharacterized protein n=1 Tax=Gonium pectorale TaxID=33097 RepID=A0A150G559_GONPE|nr:hypothetical protein GPECTOR_59g623 [Gonium pectorale]|eukprot:KXZ45016.1 hypothetical protein GPECTOR_59g623 [Gonium pectorale]
MSSPVRLGLARLSSAFKGKDGKLPEYYRQLASAESGAETWLGVARSALAFGEPERCKGILEVFLEREPRNISALLLLSYACQQLGGAEALDESVEVARSALGHASEPGDAGRAALQLAVSLGSRARLHTRQQLDRQQDRAEAIRLLEELTSATGPAAGTPTAAGADGGAAPAATPPGGALGSAHCLYCLALLHAEAGQPAEALAGARSALAAVQAAASHSAAAAGQPHAWLTCLCLALMAALLSSRGQQKMALSILSAAPCDAAGGMAALAQAKRALAAWAEGRAPLPAGATRAALEEALVQVWSELAAALAASGQRAEALAAADHALAAAPWSAATRAAAGAVHEALEEYDAAAEAYDMALALDPTHAPSLLRRAALHARRGSGPDLALARDLLGEALRYEPASAPAWHALGCCAAAAEHRAEAEAHLLTAVQLSAAAPLLPYAELPLEPLL